MQKPESVFENETHKILWDFGIHISEFRQKGRALC